MPNRTIAVAFALLVVCLPLSAQNTWTWGHRFEVRANYRWSDEERLNRPFPPGAFESTPDPGSHVELNVADLQLDLGYGEWFAARAKVHAQAKHRRNPTSNDRQIDADELWVRIGPYPEVLARPMGTTVFAQAGKFPKMERQPVRLLESYGLAATSFNRFEDVQLLVGGTVGRNFYWRLQAANGNPVFFRDPNALAGDNGIPAADGKAEYGTGFPILYNAETEDLFFDTANVQFGQAVGYRWQTEDESSGFDVIVFHYQRDLADRVELTGTFYGGDLDLLDIVHPARPDLALPISGRNKEELGARVYAEWHNATAIAQYTTQEIAGLEREGWEIEAGYHIPLRLGWITSIQPAVRYSRIDNHFTGPLQHPAPSLWWDWDKTDLGVRVGLPHGLDVTAEYTTHHVGSRAPLHLREALVTLRWRV